MRARERERKGKKKKNDIGFFLYYHYYHHFLLPHLLFSTPLVVPLGEKLENSVEVE